MAAGATYSPIATTTLGADAANITFSSIPGTYTDLVLVFVGNSTTAGTSADALNIQLNDDSGTNYSHTKIYGDGSSAASDRVSNATLFNPLEINRASGSPAFGQAIFQNYSNTTTYKSVLFRNSTANNSTSASVGLYRSTSAITKIVITKSSADIKSGSTATLYGIVAA